MNTSDHRNIPESTGHGASEHIAASRRPCHWVILFGREWRVPRRVQRWWGRYGVYIAGSTNTISDYYEKDIEKRIDRAKEVMRHAGI